MQFTRIKNDINGNPRLVVHFLAIAANYARAVKLANTIGGRKYHTRSYGGGVVFQESNEAQLEKDILAISENRLINPKNKEC